MDVAEECLRAIDSVGRHAAAPSEALLVLRERHRALAMAVREAKARVLEARAGVDRHELAVQGLLYRRAHLRACIEEARSHPCVFRTLLGPELSSAPLEELQDAAVVARLRDEKSARQQAGEAVADAQNRAELVRSRLVLRRKELERVREHLERVIQAAQPLFAGYRELLAAVEPARTAPLALLTERLSAAIADLGASEQAVLAPDGDSLRVALPKGTVVLRLTDDGRCAVASLASASDPSQGEADLLSMLSSNPVLPLTQPHAGIEPGCGLVPLRWLQAAAGLSADPSFAADIEAHVRSFVSLLL